MATNSLSNSLSRKCLKCDSENIYYKQIRRHIFTVDKNGEKKDSEIDKFGVCRQFCNDCGYKGSGLIRNPKAKKVKKEKAISPGENTKPKNGKKENGDAKKENGKEKKQDLKKSLNVKAARKNLKRETRKLRRKQLDKIPNKVTTTSYQKELERLWTDLGKIKK